MTEHPLPSRAPARRSPLWPSARSTVVGVIGDPIRHSLSPLLHNAAFDAMGLDWVSVAFEVGAADTAAALHGARALGLVGLSVTTPHKDGAAREVDERTPLAERLGSVNCVSVRRGRLFGDSTDGAGFLAALERGSGFDPRDRRCLVIGAGGAARAVVAALADAGADEVAVLNRGRPGAASAAALAGEAGRVAQPADLSGAELVVHATPVGLGDPGALHPLVDATLLGPGQTVVDLVYHPGRSALLVAAAAAGASVANGLGMLVHQAALSLEQWTGRPVPVEAMWSGLPPGVGS